MLRFAGLMVALSVALGGCMASKVVVTVNKDGSGTIEQTAFWSPDLENQGDPNVKPKAPDQAEMKKKCDEVAGRLGEGVACKSLDLLPKDKDGRNGAKAVYEFKDINKVKCPMLLPIGPMAQMGAGGDDEETVKFQYAAGKLTVNSPPPKNKGKDDGDKPKTPQEEQMEDAMIGKMFAGTVIDFSVAVNGTITQTNAKNVNKNQVDIIHADLDALAKDPEAMKAFKALQKIKDEKEMKKAYTVPPLNKYIKLEAEDKITIEFK